MVTTTGKPSGSSAGNDQAVPGFSPGGVHAGNAVANYSKIYPTLMASLKEMIQNGIDQDAKVIFVGINLDNRQVIVADNGSGTSRAGFEKALINIGFSIKEPGKLGEFGLGLVSPLDKCDHYTFSSVPRGSKAGLCWTFR